MIINLTNARNNASSWTNAKSFYTKSQDILVIDSLAPHLTPVKVDGFCDWWSQCDIFGKNRWQCETFLA